MKRGLSGLVERHDLPVENGLFRQGRQSLHKAGVTVAEVLSVPRIDGHGDCLRD